MTREEIAGRIVELIASDLDVHLQGRGIGPSTRLFEGGLGLDSFAVVELISVLESEFAFEFPETDLTPENFVDPLTLSQVVKHRMEGNAETS